MRPLVLTPAGAVVVLLLLAGCGPRSPAPVPTAEKPLAEAPGAASSTAAAPAAADSTAGSEVVDRLVLVVNDLHSLEANRYVLERLNDLAEPDGSVASHRFSTSAAISTITLRWRGVPREFAARIDFGKPTLIGRDQIQVTASLPHPLPPPSLQQTLRELRSGNSQTRGEAARRLLERKPNERRNEVAELLRSALERERDDETRRLLIEALGIWSDGRTVSDLVELLHDRSVPVRWAAMQTLAKTGDERGAEYLARCLLTDLQAASRALESMGPAAESAVLSYIDHFNPDVRLEVCRILRTIASDHSVPSLRRALGDEDPRIVAAAKEALGRLGAPLELAGSEAAPGGTGPPAAPSRAAPQAGELAREAKGAVAAEVARAAEDADSTRRKISIPFPTPGDGDVLFPIPPSDFVAIGQNRDGQDLREVWDLRAGKQMGLIRGQLQLEGPWALSPDGRYLAGRLGFNRGIEVWSFERGRQLRRLELKVPPHVLEFVGPDRLLTVNTQEHVFRIWNVERGRLEREIELAQEIHPRSVTVSPGGRQVACAIPAENSVRIYDLESGALIRRIEVPGDGHRRVLQCWGLAFSPEADQLGGLFEGWRTTHLISWDCQSGELLVHHHRQQSIEELAVLDRGYLGKYLDWLPDKSGWLVFGHSVFDRQTGVRLWADSLNLQDPLRHARRFLDAEHMLVVSGAPRQRVLESVSLPWPQIERVRQFVLEGGRRLDADLPPLSRGDWSQARRLEIDLTERPWTLTPSALPGSAAAAGEVAFDLGSSVATVRKVAFSAPEAARLVVAHEAPAAGRFGVRAQLQDEARWLELFQIQDGQPPGTGRASGTRRLGRFDLPAVCSFVALSPGGTHAATVDSIERQRIDVWSLETQQHVAGWRPFEGPQDEDSARVTWSEFVADDRLLTISGAGTLAMWQLPQCQALYTIQPLAAAPPVLSPNGEQLAVWTEQSLALLDPQDGSTAGVLRPPVELEVPQHAGLRPCAFRSGGSEIAATVRARGGADKLISWDLRTGQVRHVIDVGRPAQHLEWCGPGHLLVGGSPLVDLRHARTVWHYSPHTQACEILRAPGERHWFVYRARPERLALAAVQLPHDEVRGLLGMLDDPQTQAILRPHVALPVHVRLPGPTGQEEAFHKQLADLITSKLQELQVRVSRIEHGETPVLPFAVPDQPLGQSTGTAVAVNPDGYLITCAHVVEHASRVQATLGDKSFDAQLVAMDRQRDLALLKVNARLRPLPLADSDNARLGEEVRAFGFPLAGELGDSLKVTRGTISGIISEADQKLFQIDASINPGNSGGPLVDRSGRVLGINSALLVGLGGTNVGFAVPANDARRMLQKKLIPLPEPAEAAETPEGPDLVEQVAPSVALVTATLGGGGVQTVVDQLVTGPALVVQAVELESAEAWEFEEEIFVRPGLRIERKYLVPKIHLIYTVALVDAAGQVVWESRGVLKPNAISGTELKDGIELLETHVRAHEWQMLYHRIRDQSLPYFVAMRGEEIVRLPGSSELPRP